MKIVEEAESLMLYQFKDAPKLKGLLCSLIQPLQVIADGVEHFSHGVHIDEVSGHWLDVLGGIVGQSRSGMSDKDFRTWLKIRVMLNRCNGTPEELLSIIKLLLGSDYPLTLAEHKPKDIVMVFLAPMRIPSPTVFSLIRNASPLGLRHHFVNASVNSPFQLDKSAFSSAQFAEFFHRGKT